MSGFQLWLYKMTLFVLCEMGLKTYPHADAKQRKTLLWPNHNPKSKYKVECTATRTFDKAKARSSKHHLLTGHIHRVPLVETRYIFNTGLPVVKANMDMAV
jgi:hypothetical protein